MKNRIFRSPSEWLKKIEELPKEVQSCIAKLIWWDYFGCQLNFDRWPHLDKYLRYDPAAPLIEPAIVAKHLVELGYDPEDAVRRSTIETLKKQP